MKAASTVLDNFEQMNGGTSATEMIHDGESVAKSNKIENCGEP